MSALYPLQNPLTRTQVLPTTMAFRGTWNATTQYYINETVLSPTDGALYLTTVPILGGADPSVGAATWIDITKGASQSLTSLITAPQSIIPPISPAPPQAFVNNVAVPTVAGKFYDVQARGKLLGGGAGGTNANDVINVVLTAGAGVGSVWTYQFRPSTTPTTGDWQIRDRIYCDVGQPSLLISVQQVLIGATPYTTSIIQFDVEPVN